MAAPMILRKATLPRTFDGLARLMTPQAIRDDEHLARVVDVIDRLMAGGRLSSGQSSYLETLVQLVQAYESRHYAIETSAIRGGDSLRFLMHENDLSASDLGRLLGVHTSMGSKILKGERALTLGHCRKLARHFKVSPALFIE